ncbi:MAG: lipoyl(octanoyl) transferase LipB [Phycisphaerales bacterium]|nr:MAG: lipoyl(octanoyl) transferase LipB [Phycisphaerales bacterium]
MAESPPEIELTTRDLGRVAYGEAFALQKKLQGEVIQNRETASGRGDGGRLAGFLLLLEHEPPVITISRRKTAPQHLLATPDELAAAGVEIHQTDRGGDITYHGPGQLVVYPILDLNVLGLRVRSYMRFLEQVVIDTLGRFGIASHQDESATGVWVSASQEHAKAPGKLSRGFEGDSKICAMGVRITRWVSMHGLALNVTTNLDHYRFIIPCGLEGRPVTSMRQLLGEKCPTMEQVKEVLTGHFRAQVNRLACTNRKK